MDAAGGATGIMGGLIIGIPCIYGGIGGIIPGLGGIPIPGPIGGRPAKPGGGGIMAPGPGGRMTLAIGL